MKNLLTLTALISTLATIAQTVDHFDEPSAKWHVARTSPAATPEFPAFIKTTTNIWGFQGDTLISGDLWLKLFESTDSLFVDDLQFRGYIRSQEDIILFRGLDLQLDTLYDFTIEPGDFVGFSLDESSNVTLELISTDFIEVEGILRKWYFFSTEWSTLNNFVFDIWIEGIGSIQGPLNSLNPAQSSNIDSTRVTCVYVSENLSWQNPDYDSCNPSIVLSAIDLQLEGISAFPNPFFNKFQVINPLSRDLDLVIYNSSGRIIHRLQCPPGQAVINLTGIAEGLYFLTYSDGSTSKTVKMVKMR